ncbi:MAG: hypothetical protein DIU61_010450 [Bacteroidota bacterium]|nr:hypothetical protein [Cyclobacteriaceae bacterium]
MKVSLALSVVTLVSFIILMKVLSPDSEPWRIAFAAIAFVGFLTMTLRTIYLVKRRSRR